MRRPGHAGRPLREMLRIYNSLTRHKQAFVPIEPGKARLYVCGMTVYDYCHLGHARVMVVFDVVRRWLRALGFAVTYVRNITDIDDKIIKRAQENGESVESLTARFIEAMHEDNAALGVEAPDHEPRATAYVPGMLDMIAALERRGLAYRAANGDVNFSVRKFPDYGKLSGRSLDDLRAGERVEVDAAKHDPLDFVLWKQAKSGEPAWDSPWGKGRPGWHIECSVMSSTLLGNHFDIHGGGQDLQFPHHENEIAQSEGANQSTFVNYWMHNGFVRVDNEKMSKSLGNFFTVREVRAKYDPEVIRYFIVRAHYRSPLNYSDRHLDDAKHALTRLYTALADAELLIQASVSVVPPEKIDWGVDFSADFRSAMNDDFNTPEAVSSLFQLASEINRLRNALVHEAHKARGQEAVWKNKLVDLATTLKSLGGILGLLGHDPRAFLQGTVTGHGSLEAGSVAMQGVGVVTHTPESIEKLIASRTAARKAKNFAKADRIRNALLEEGIVLEDTPDGRTTWRRS